MNTENEKRWFVYIGDHHEGPLSVPEVFDKKQKGLILPESYVWREGMADWLMLSQVPELTQALEALAPAPVAVNAVSESAAPSQSDAPAPEAVTSGKPSEEAGSVAIPEPTSSAAPAKKPNAMAKKLAIGLISGVGLLALLSLGILAAGSRTSDTALHARLRPILHKIITKAPFTRGLFKLVPALSDVKPQDLVELEAARSGTPDVEAKIAVALSVADPNRPLFYVSTNLSHRTRFEVLLIGVPDTLLNRLQFTLQNTLVTTHGLGKSETFLMDGGQPIPKGEYEIYVFDSAEQEEEVKTELNLLPPNKGQAPLPASVPGSVRFVISKKLFLGGERDETYLTRLKAFHESIKEKAEKELAELRQFVDTLILQQNSMNTDFQKVFRAKKVTAGLKNQWKKTSSAWTQISGQLDQAIQTWSPETLQNEFFYGKAYALVKTAFASMQTQFKAEMDFIDKPSEKAAFEIQHGKLLSDSRDALEQLKTKVELILKAPKTPSGLPTKEGL